MVLTWARRPGSGGVDRAEIWACSRSGLARSPLLQLKWSPLAEFQSSGLRAIVDLPPQRGIGAVVADEEGAEHVAEFLDGLVGGVLGAAAGEAAQDLLGFGGAQPQRGGVLDHLVVLAADQVPAAALVFAQALPGGAEPGPDESRSYAQWLGQRLGAASDAGPEDCPLPGRLARRSARHAGRQPNRGTRAPTSPLPITSSLPVPRPVLSRGPQFPHKSAAGRRPPQEAHRRNGTMRYSAARSL